MGSDLVALSGGLFVPLGGGQGEPFIGFRHVPLGPEAAGGKNAEIVLAVGHAVLGGLAEPLGGVGIIGLALGAFRIKDRQVVHGLGVAFAGCGEIEPLCRRQVFFHALTLFEHAGV